MRLIRDLRFAVRSLTISRAHTAVAVLTLAAGIGVNVAVFSVLDSVLLRPLPFPEADRDLIAQLIERRSGRSPS